MQKKASRSIQSHLFLMYQKVFGILSAITQAGGKWDSLSTHGIDFFFRANNQWLLLHELAIMRSFRCMCSSHNVLQAKVAVNVYLLFALF